MKAETRELFEIDWKKPLQAIVKITPSDAVKVLENHNGGNRFLRKAGSRYIAVQIRSGEWISDHPQPICFSTKGMLLDGQHRMAGIALSGESVMASVRFGVNPEFIKYIDTGISRTLGDRVDFVQNKSVNKIVSAMVNTRFGMRQKCKPTPEQALSVFYECQESYVVIAENNSGKRHVGSSVVGLAFVDYHQRHGDESVEMYNELFKKTTDCQPAQALKNFLLETNMRGPAMYPYIVSTCIANHEKRIVKVVRAAAWR